MYAHTYAVNSVRLHRSVISRRACMRNLYRPACQYRNIPQVALPPAAKRQPNKFAAPEPSGLNDPSKGLWSMYHIGIILGHSNMAQALWCIWSLRTMPLLLGSADRRFKARIPSWLPAPRHAGRSPSTLLDGQNKPRKGRKAKTTSRHISKCHEIKALSPKIASGQVPKYHEINALNHA